MNNSYFRNAPGATLMIYISYSKTDAVKNLRKSTIKTYYDFKHLIKNQNCQIITDIYLEPPYTQQYLHFKIHQPPNK